MNKDQLSRRSFLGVTGAALAAASIGDVSRGADTRGRLFAYVGRECVNVGGPGAGTIAFLGGPQGGGVDAFEVNMADGSLRAVGSSGPEAADLNSESMCVSHDSRFVYCCNRTAALHGIPGTGGGVDAFAINHEDGSLRYLNAVPSMGAMPACVRIDKTSSRVIVGNHGAVGRVTVVTKKDGVVSIERPTDSATVALFAVASDGSLGPLLDVSIFGDTPAPGTRGIRPEAIGPTGFVQIGPACHGVAFDWSQRWIVASDNGYDHIYVYPFNAHSRKLEGRSYPVAPGSAPRHIAVHPHAPYFFITNEREPSVSSFHLDPNSGALRFVQTMSTIPQGYSPPRNARAALAGASQVSPADIRVHPSGKFLYSSNRVGGGTDSIAVFGIDTDSGRLTRVDVTDTVGGGQREFNVEPSGKYLFACHMQTNEVITFAIDPDTGKLTRTASTHSPRAAVVDFATL